MRSLLCAVALLLAGAVSVEAQTSANCRLYLAAQYDWGAAKGFYLDFEGGTLAELPAILAVGDGKAWRLPTARPGFVFDRDYRLRAEIAPGRATLSVDGKVVADSPGAWQPAGATLTLNERPEWAAEQGDWIARVHRLDVIVTRPSKVARQRSFSFVDRTLPTPLLLFEPYQPESFTVALLPTDTVTLDLTLSFSRAEAAAGAPLIDAYGQARDADFPAKVKGDDDLRRDLVEEDARLAKWPPSPKFDRYGGYRGGGWKEPATGFFRAAKRDGFWWLLSPEGNPCFYLGVSQTSTPAWDATGITGRERLFADLPRRDGPWAAAWGSDAWSTGDGVDYLNWHAANLIRKYGEGWQARGEERMLRRLRAWGFSGGGKWGAPATIVSTPVLSYAHTPKLVSHPDVFDPAVRAAARADLAAQIGDRVRDPFVLGWSMGSEKEELIAPEEVTGILARGEAVPAKRALLDYALDTLHHGSVADLATAWGLSVTTREQLYAATPAPPPAEAEQLRLFYADRYYAFNYDLIKEVDPNHLYLGCYLCPTCEERAEDLRRIYRHCDVMSYDLYSPTYGNGLLARLEAEFDRPIFIGEFSYPGHYQGRRGYGRFRVSAKDEAESGEKYRAWVRAAAADPRCVGGTWFQYEDQALTGRGPGHGSGVVYGEHYAFGLITETDRPKWDLITRMRDANLAAPGWRFAAAGARTR